MKHDHVGPEEYACSGCVEEAQAGFRKAERRKTITGLLLLIALIVGGLIVLARNIPR